jgi:hypothetical protein
MVRWLSAHGCRIRIAGINASSTKGATMAAKDEKPGTWAESQETGAEFNGLLKKYGNDVEKATAAQLRGEKPDPEDETSPTPL